MALQRAKRWVLIGFVSIVNIYTRQRSSQLAAALLATVILFVGQSGAVETPPAGLVVEEVKPHFAADRAGIRPGDILVGWSLSGDVENDDGTAFGTLSTPFDLAELEKELHPKDPVTLHLVRGEKASTVTLGSGHWRIGTKPRWDQAIDVRYGEIRSQLVRGDTQVGIDAATNFAGEILDRGEALHAAWLLARAAETLGTQGRRQEATHLYRLSVETSSATGNLEAQAFLQQSLAKALLNQSLFDEAHDAFAAALEIQKEISPDRLGVAMNLVWQGALETRRGRMSPAMDYLEQGLWLLEKLAPDSMLVAGALGEMGRVANRQGNLAQGEQYFRRALSIAEALVPEGIEVAAYLNGVGIVMRLRGDEAGAESLYERALMIATKLEPDSQNLAVLLNNLATIKKDRGDYRTAMDYFHRALALHERSAPDSLSVAIVLTNLGELSLLQGDLTGAEVYHKRAHAMRKELTPDSLDLARTLTSRGDVARLREAHDVAEVHYRDALEITRRLAPMSPEHANAWVNLGLIAQSGGDATSAQARIKRGLSIFDAIAPNGRGVAESLTKLGDIAREQGLLDIAEQRYRGAFSILVVIGPQTYPEAHVLYGLASVFRLRQDNAAAKSYFERALRSLEEQHSRLGGTEETKAAARSRYLPIYKDYIDLLLELDEQEKAFDVLERSRSQVLSDMLSERDLVFAVDIPPDLERQRRMQALSYERLQAELYNTQDLDRVEALQESLYQVRREQVQIQQQIRESSPRLADLHYVTPISLAGVRSTLKHDTAVLSYNVGESETQLFVLSPHGDLVVRTLPLGHGELDALVTRFRYVIDGGRWDENEQAPLIELATSLYRRLVLPAEPHINAAGRILIVPDGPLNVLPFAALLRPSPEGTPLYLAQWKPSHVVNSLTVYAQLREQRSRFKRGNLIAFGDPDYSDSAAGRPESYTALRAAVAGSFLSELPWSGDEVEAIRDIYRTDATVYTRAEATEERAKAMERDVRYVHFAAHTVLNERRPMDTAIALATPRGSSTDEENGLLQAWEVYESLRLYADLVTLSACETALGTDYPGEGLIGLTRAFQYAGASSVLASLWKVNDRSTSRLMTEFYANLKSGMPQEDALQQAQIAMIRGAVDADESAPGWMQTIRAWFTGDESQANHAHPYHWAGFVLSGLGG